MFPSEMIILMAIAVARDPDKKLLCRPLDVTGEYIGYLCKSLIKRGFLVETKPKGYQLTAQGMSTLFNFLSKNKNRTLDMIKMLQQLGIDIGQEVYSIDRELIATR
jgi:predicted transcriptional regulator